MENFIFTKAKKWKSIFCILLFVLTISLAGFSQNVGINATGVAPNASAGLDVDFPNMGLLIPRVALTGTANFTPLPGTPVAGMIVYNTAIAGDVKPGFYYNDGSKWVAGFPAGNAIGDMLYWNGVAWNLLPVGTTGQYLTLNASNIPFWANAAVSASIVTTAASAVTGITATSGGNITSDGGSAVLSRGVCWKTTTAPTIADSKTVDGAGIGIFASSLSTLTPVTTYYVRAYAMNSSSITYGNEISFTTLPVLPTVATTTAATAITGTTATTGGNVTNTGGATITERGVCFGTAANPTIANTKVINPTPGLGSFVSNITGLLGYTTYYVRGYATNSAGTGYGAQISFKTTGMPSVLVTVAATAINGTGATSGGSATSGGAGYSYGNRGVAYSTVPNSPTHTLVSIGFITTFPAAPWVTNLTGLVSNTTYYIRSYLDKYDPTTVFGTNAWSTDFGNELSFTTGAPSSPIVTSTTAISGISDRYANSGGAITSDGGSAITAKGVCWGTTASPALGVGNFTTNGTGPAAFISNIAGLTGNTLYYVRAYATNALGTAYGPTDVTFTTWVTAPYTLGQNVGYGWCAYVDPLGHGFIVSYDIPSAVGWGCSGTSIATSTALGSGQANTTLILASCATRPIAASVAASHNGGGFTDWYLPSALEMGKIGAIGSQVGIGSSLNNYYTSSQSSATYVSSWFTNYSSGYASGASKLAGANDYVNQLRAIRNF